MSALKRIRVIRIFAYLIVLTTAPAGIGFAQSGAQVAFRQTATVQTVDGTCHFEGNVVTCSARPATMRLSFNATAPGSSLLIVALLPVNGCADDRGQVWSGSSVEFSIYTSGYHFWFPPTTARVDGLTSVVCDVSTSFVDVSRFGGPGSSGYEQEQVLQFFELSTVNGSQVKAALPVLSFGLAQAYVCQANAPDKGLAIAGILARQDTSDPSALQVVSGVATGNNVVREVWDGFTYYYGEKAAYAQFSAGGAQAAVQCSSHNCGCFQATFTAPESAFEIVTGTGSGPQDPTTVSKSTTESITARYRLGSTFFIQLVRKEADGSRTPLPSSFALANAVISPSITGATLFSGNVAIEFDRNTTGTVKYFQAVHRGAVNLVVTPTDTSINAVTMAINVIPPDSLGTTQPTYDAALIDKAHQRGIPPQFLKGQVQQESRFNPQSYRYEPLSIDLASVSGGRNHVRTVAPYSLYRLATSDGLAQGTQILTADISPRSVYRINRNGTLRAIADADQFVSASEIYTANDATQHWSTNSPARAQTVRVNPALLNFTAQTPLASSYGLLQILYTTAIAPMRWTGVNGAQNPSNLFDINQNIAAGGGSLELGSGYLRRIFSQANPSVNVASPNFTAPADLNSAFQNAFNFYNHSNTTGQYGPSIMQRALSFLPRSATPIF